MADTEDDHGSNVARSPRRWLFGVLLVIVVYAVGLVVVGIDEALGAFTRASVLPLIGALMLQASVQVLWGKVYGASAAAVNGPLKTTAALRVSMPAFTLSHTLPGGGLTGNAVAVRRLSAQGLNGPSATAAVALTATISLSTIAGLGSAGIVTAFLAGDLPTFALVIALPVLVALVALVATVVAVLHSPSAGDRAVGLLGKLHHRLREHGDEWRDSLRDVTEDPPTPKQLSRIVGWALCKWSADIGSLALVFFALGTTPRITALLVGFGVTQLATAIPVTPGGVGFVESGMVGAFVALGYPATLATSVVVVYRVLETWLPALAGVPVLLRQPPPEQDPLA
ncbi:MAG: flippase-like domain-containing protein [Intrasporangiaceae bacterium]|nr:flippase-like domain-containing protein [Intrasporangiaceae bacterium]